MGASFPSAHRLQRAAEVGDGFGRCGLDGGLEAACLADGRDPERSEQDTDHRQREMLAERAQRSAWATDTG